MRFCVVTKPFIKSPMRYYHIRNTYGAPRLLTFCEKETAMTFKRYLVHHRSTYGCWPDFDASQQHNKELQQQGNSHSEDSISKHVHIIGWDDDTICIPYVTSKRFEHNKEHESVYMHASEECDYFSDVSLARSRLEYLL